MYNIEEYIADRNRLSALRKAIENPGPDGHLQSAKIKITPRCNLRCRMCGIWKYRGQRELPTARMEALIAELASMGCRKIHFSGGEPLMREDIFRLLEKCRALKIRANLTTNGTLVTKDIAKQLIKCGARGISISIDGPNARVHDGIRNVEGSFKLATRAIEMLTSARDNFSRGRTRIRVNTVLQRSNWRDLPEIVKLAGELGANDVEPMPVDSKNGQPRLKKSEIKDYNLCVAPEVQSIRQRYGFADEPLHVYPFGSTKSDIAFSVEGNYARGYYETNLCHAPWLHAFIAWDGAVYPCCMTRGRVQSLGDVAESSMREIFSGGGYIRMRSSLIKKRLSYCHKCDNFLKENNILRRALGE